MAHLWRRDCPSSVATTLSFCPTSLHTAPPCARGGVCQHGRLGALLRLQQTILLGALEVSLQASRDPGVSFHTEGFVHPALLHTRGAAERNCQIAFLSRFLNLFFIFLTFQTFFFGQSQEGTANSGQFKKLYVPLFLGFYVFGQSQEETTNSGQFKTVCSLFLGLYRCCFT